MRVRHGDIDALQTLTVSGTKSVPVSVVMCCYNGERWLSEAIDSIVHQTLLDFEFIIVDDGSTDRSSQIMEDCARRDSRIRVIAKRNTGLTDSLNVAIQNARGEWVARIDADDICERERLEEQLRSAKKDPSIVFVGTGIVEIDELGRPLRRWLYPERHESLVRNLRQLRKFPAHSSAMFRRDAVVATGGYRTRIMRSQDLDLWLRLSQVGRFVTVRKPLVRVRVHPGQISSGQSRRGQKIDAYIALITYWLRNFGFPDPVEGDLPTYSRFHGWVEASVQRHQVVEYSNFVWQLSRAFAETGTGKVAALIWSAVMSPRFVARYLQRAIAGERLGRILACEWMQEERLRLGGQGASRTGPSIVGSSDAGET